VRRETGKEEVAQVHCDEDVASHIDPESCAGIREDVGEALTGERAGQPLGREKFDQDTDAVPLAQGNTGGRDVGYNNETRQRAIIDTLRIGRNGMSSRPWSF
jgi:hypothetical protein